MEAAHILAKFGSWVVKRLWHESWVTSHKDLIQTQRLHDVIITSLLGQNDVATSFDVIMTLSLRYLSTGSTYRVGQSREIYSNSVPLSPPHWPYPKRIRPPSWPRVAVASSIQNTKLFTWRTWPGAGAVPKCDWAARSQCGFKQRRADHTK